MVDIKDLGADEDQEDEKPRKRLVGGAIDRSLLNAGLLSPLYGLRLPSYWEMQEAMRAVSAIDGLALSAHAVRPLSEMASAGDLLSAAAAVPQLPDSVLELTQSSFLSDPVADIVRSAESLVRFEQSFFNDIRLTEQLLASADLAQTIDTALAPSMSTLFADLDRIANIGRHVFETHSITLEQFSLKIDSLEPFQLELLVRQATTALEEEVRRRGWSDSSSSDHPSTASVDADSELSSAVEEVLADAPPEQAAAFRRFWNALATQRAGTLVNLLLVAVTLISLFSSVPANDDSDADSPNANIHIQADDVSHRTASAQPDLANVGEVLLDAFDDDLDLQSEIVRYLHEVDQSTTSDPVDAARPLRWDQLVELLSRAPSIDEDQLYQAYRRAADQRELMASVKMLGAQDLRSLMPDLLSSKGGETRSLEDLRSRGELLGVLIRGTWRYPADQFDQCRVREPLPEVLSRARARGYDEWEILHWLTTPRVSDVPDVEPGRPIDGLGANASLDDIVSHAAGDDEARKTDPPMGSPFEWLARGGIDAFRAAASRWLG